MFDFAVTLKTFSIYFSCNPAAMLSHLVTLPLKNEEMSLNIPNTVWRAAGHVIHLYYGANNNRTLE